ncbi:GtrA family protein [Lacticaseibacillus mingshuiensis]|uniref:GtrA family protein n=1 Tax=Lacticaseibacillus mingshuiensis TaxID=2799574 RepID=A0ABW4CIH3_9LACO|nr:GtrA family protein [Lacticaseibacillus mingshuiensis]
MNWLKRVWQDSRFQETFWYVFFGGWTTVVNFVVYFLFRSGLGWGVLSSNSFAWIASVLFAFFTNKRWVFHSKTSTIYATLLELFKFVFYRLVSFGIDQGMMLLFIDGLHIGDFISKLMTQVFVLVANYLFSKLLIFNRSKKEDTEE